jgi:hypothetical protein
MQKPRTTSYDAAKRSRGNGWSRTVGVAPKLRAGGKAGLRQAGTTDPHLANLGADLAEACIRSAAILRPGGVAPHSATGEIRPEEGCALSRSEQPAAGLVRER